MKEFTRCPLVSVLVPTWNRSRTIERNLQSILNSTYNNIEVVVVDNGSIDNTCQIVREFAQVDSRVKLISHATNVGALNNWIRCINESTGDYIKFVWSDDSVESNTIESLIAPLLIDPTIGFSYCAADVHCSNASESHVRIMYNNYHSKRTGLDVFVAGFALRIPHLPVSPGLALIRRSVLIEGMSQLSGMDNDCVKKAIGPDVVLMYSCVTQGLFGYFVSGTKVNFYDEGDSISGLSQRKVLNYCYDKAVLYVLRSKPHHQYAFYLLRKFRSVIDIRSDRSSLEKSLFADIDSRSLNGVLLAIYFLLLALIQSVSILFKRVRQ